MKSGPIDQISSSHRPNIVGPTISQLYLTPLSDWRAVEIAFLKYTKIYLGFGALHYEFLIQYLKFKNYMPTRAIQNLGGHLERHWYEVIKK